MTACAAGCLIPARHVAEHDEGDTCTGCLPARVATGLLVCERCYGRLRLAISTAPDLVGHLLDMVEPQAAPVDSGGAGVAGPRPPLSVEALGAADEVQASLASWAALIVEERGVQGPSWAGSDVRPASKRRTSAGMVYEDARVVGVKTPEGTATVVRWLLIQTEWACQQSWADEICREIPETIWTLRAKWPTEQRPVYLPIPCPACGSRSLVRYAPRWAGAPVAITCELVDCQHTVPEDRYGWLTKVATAARNIPSQEAS